MQNSNFEPMIDAMQNHLTTVKGEVYNFSSNTKKSGAVARKCLLNIMKIAKTLRQEIQDAKNAMPVHRRNMTPEKKQMIVAKRLATMAKKSNKTVVTPPAA